MKAKINIFLLPIILVISSCQFGPDESDTISDAELIQLIIEANKIVINLDDLPSQSRTVIENEIEYDGIGASKASGLGYEVELAGRGHRSGRRNEVYFNLEGRKLDPNDWGRKGRYWDRDDGNKEDWKCFELVFPVTFDMPDGSIITVTNDDEDGWAEIKAWYEANPDAEERPALQYPVVIFFEEESITVNSDEDMREAYGECYTDRDGWGRKRECFELVYPVTFIMPDGSSITIETDDENSWEELKDWYDENEGYEEVRPELEYPVDIVYETNAGDSIVTINTEEEMMIVKQECREEFDENRECFELVLPVTYLMPDGTSITIEDEDGYMTLREWYEENQSEEEPALQYPVDIVYETDEGDVTVTINNEEEMNAFREECEDNENGRP